MIKRKTFGIKKTKKRRKKGEITKLKEVLWQLCRQIQIKKYGTTCYTCGKFIEKGIHTGHFITSSTCSPEVRYDLQNLRPQCYHCNINLSGNWIAFEKKLLQEGIDIEALKTRNAATKGMTYSPDWFRAQILTYQAIFSQANTKDSTEPSHKTSQTSV